MSTPNSRWPFRQQRNCAVITTRQILERSECVLHAAHLSRDHEWRFLTLAKSTGKDARIVTLEDVVALDPSVTQIADLPPGWHAWRCSKTDAWIREPDPNDIAFV